MIAAFRHLAHHGFGGFTGTLTSGIFGSLCNLGFIVGGFIVAGGFRMPGWITGSRFCIKLNCNSMRVLTRIPLASVGL
jgi:hypothetical protein